MSSYDAEDAWDFTSVIDLNRSLSSKQAAQNANDSLSSPASEEILTPTLDDAEYGGGGELGNFDKIWEFLGQPCNLPPPIVPAVPDDATEEWILSNSENPQTLLELSVRKGVRWRDDTGTIALVDESNHLANDSTPQLPKARRKKPKAEKQAANRKLRRRNLSNPKASSGETNWESDSPNITPLQNRSSIIQNYIDGTTRTLTTTPNKKETHLAVNSANQSIDEKYRHTTKSSLKPSEAAIGDIASKTRALISKLINRFVEDRQHIYKLNSISFTKNVLVNAESGLHVFVDSSNIMIGFHDALKMSRGLDITSRIRRQPISFHNLSLILERGRPTAKRVLVGSDNFPAIREAKTLGYETNILDRVHKAKELTPRQKKFQNTNGTICSGSETTAAMYAPEKWVEQAVDEILHLKILESVVDADKPSTIVLATGDAAEAEYSQGFLKMVERALGKGWKVEVCSFKKNISGSYRKKEFRTKWASQFKIIEMDEFVEEILGIE